MANRAVKADTTAKNAVANTCRLVPPLANKKIHAEKDEDGKSIAGKKSAATRNAKKDEDGKSISAMKSNATIHAVKDEDGKSVAAMKSPTHTVAASPSRARSRRRRATR